MFIHRQRHQRDAEPGGDALDERVGQGLDAAAAAGRHHRGEGGRDALPAVGGEHHLLGPRRPVLVLTGEIIRGDFSQARRSGAGRLPQRGLERLRPVQSFQAFGDQRRLRRQHRIIEFQIDPRAARLGRCGDAAARFAGNERAASDFADHEAAAQQLGVDPARRRGGDLALIGKGSLRRQAVARLEDAAGDLGGDGIGELGVFEFRHYCTESNVLLAPIQLQDHLSPIKPEIAPRRARAIRGR